MKWLRDNFLNAPEEVNETSMQQRIRAYLLYLFRTVLFPDKTGSYVSLIYIPLLADLSALDTYSWGSAALTCLYRNLYRGCTSDVDQISRPLILSQL